MGTNFDRVMREQGRKATWLADQIGFSNSLIAKIRRGERTASPAFRRAAARALDMDEAELFPEPEQAVA